MLLINNFEGLVFWKANISAWVVCIVTTHNTNNKTVILPQYLFINLLAYYLFLLFFQFPLVGFVPHLVDVALILKAIFEFCVNVVTAFDDGHHVLGKH